MAADGHGSQSADLSVPIDYAPETGEDETGLPMPEDHWSDYYTLTSAIDYDSGTYYIDQTFFYDLLAHPEWFIGDSTYIVLDGSDWELIGVSPGTVAYALGLQTGDILLSINAYDLSTPAGALDAFSSLQAATKLHPGRRAFLHARHALVQRDLDLERVPLWPQPERSSWSSDRSPRAPARLRGSARPEASRRTSSGRWPRRSSRRPTSPSAASSTLASVCAEAGQECANRCRAGAAETRIAEGAAERHLGGELRAAWRPAWRRCCRCERARPFAGKCPA